jgi:hypothetical protein
VQDRLPALRLHPRLLRPLTTIEEAFRSVLLHAARGEVSFPRDLQGFPGTVHGGAVAGLFHRVTTPSPPVRLRMELLRSVPTETALRLATGSAGTVARLSLIQGDRPVAQAELTRGEVDAPDPGATLEAWRQRRGPGDELPHTATCLACGSENPLGLALRLRFDDRFVWCEYTPSPRYRAADGSAHPALATVALDELGWWLGALALSECGVTTEVAVTVSRPFPPAPLLLLGDRTAVGTDEDPRGRYVRMRSWLLTADGGLLAAADVRFAGSPAYTRRLLQPFLDTTVPDRLFRIFPGARALAERSRGGPTQPT